MFSQTPVICLCMALCIAAPANLRAEEPARDGPDTGLREVRPWVDPPPTNSRSAERGERSRDHQSALGLRVRLLEDRITALSQALKTERDRDGLVVQADTALRNVEELKAQAREDQEAALRLTAKAEGLRKQLAAINLERGDPGTLMSATAPATGASSLASASSKRPSGQTERSTLGSDRAKIRTSKVNSSPPEPARRRNIRQAQNDSAIYKAENRRAFILPSVLRPIRF